MHLRAYLAISLLLFLPVLSACASVGHELDDWLDFLAKPEAGCQTVQERPIDQEKCEEEEEDSDQGSSPWAQPEEQVAFDQLNALRAREGVPGLVWKASSRLQKAAKQRAKELAELFSHTRPDGRDCSSVLADFGIGFSATGENIAYGSKLGASGVMRLWEKSPGHRRNMLDRSYREVGLASWQASNGQVFWVQIFLRR